MEYSSIGILIRLDVKTKSKKRRQEDLFIYLLGVPSLILAGTNVTCTLME